MDINLSLFPSFLQQTREENGVKSEFVSTEHNRVSLECN